MGSGGIAPRFLTSTLDGGVWSASRPGRITSGEIALGYPLNVRLGEPQSCSGHYGEVKKSLASAWNQTTVPRSPSS
jgi:hypothetical protein